MMMMMNLLDDRHIGNRRCTANDLSVIRTTQLGPTSETPQKSRYWKLVLLFSNILQNCFA